MAVEDRFNACGSASVGTCQGGNAYGVVAVFDDGVEPARDRRIAA